MLDQFFYLSYMPPGDLHGTYNYMLVALSYAVASFASYVALYIAKNTHLEGKRNYWWLSAGALTLGVGIWTMHFIGMEAFIMPMPMGYDPLRTILSMSWAILAAAIAFFITSREHCSLSLIAVGGIVIGLGICCMHYVGMSAMLGMNIRYVPSYFILSVFIAIIASQVAMWLMINIEKISMRYRKYARLCSALIMGIAICGMHYTGMAAAIFYADHGTMSMVWSDSTISAELLSLTLAMTTILIIGMGLILAVYQAKVADHERSTKTILKTVADGIMQIEINGTIETCNPAAEKIFGCASGSMSKKNFYDFIKSNTENEESVDLDQIYNSDYKNIELIGRKKNNDLFPIEMTISKLIMSQGEFFVITIRDISERKKSEKEVYLLNQRLVDLAKRAGMIEVTNSVLHNVGNVLNSINTSATIIHDKIKTSEVVVLSDIAKLMDNHRNNLNDFLTKDEKGQKCLEFILLLGKVLPEEQGDVMKEILSLTNKVEHVKHIIQMQQSIGGNHDLLEEIDVLSVINDALSINGLDKSSKFTVKTHFQDIPRLLLNKVKLVQIIVNILQNAKAAIIETGKDIQVITISLFTENDKIVIEIEDNGVGIDQETLKQVFSFGFTTKKHGHGFGLHSSLISAQEMGGRVTVQSQGKGTGAKFKLELPYQTRETNNLVHVDEAKIQP